MKQLQRNDPVQSNISIMVIVNSSIINFTLNGDWPNAHSGPNDDANFAISLQSFSSVFYWLFLDKVVESSLRQTFDLPTETTFLEKTRK